ncbi:thymidylate kinase [Paenarthrobacter sp. NPDC058040]|uniref:thymidylate kinase n=1 Tax=unclassified Paenarthrobacter TaxID=2634190 RepID=UPI0036DCFFFD
MLMVLTGIDGSGKTTAARALVAATRSSGRAALLLSNHAARRRLSNISRRIGWRLPSRLADALETSIRVSNVLVSHVRARLFARRHPGGLVVMDRHLQCQLALRGAHGLRRGKLIPWLLDRLPAPDALVFIDAAPELAHHRVAVRGTDEESLDHLAAFRAAYSSAPGFGEFVVVDANGTPEEVLEKLVRLVGPAESPRPGECAESPPLSSARAYR